jgi:hypothetical protein
LKSNLSSGGIVQLWVFAAGTTLTIDQAFYSLTIFMRSALFILHAASFPDDTVETQNRLYQVLEPISTRISEFSNLLFIQVEHVDLQTLSPFVPYSLYQAAVVQLNLWKRTDIDSYRNAFESLKTVLGHFKKRWLVAGMCFLLLSCTTQYANSNGRCLPERVDHGKSSDNAFTAWIFFKFQKLEKRAEAAIFSL